MYKINEVADLLKVSRVHIFEVMLSQRELFGPLTTKVNGVTLISDEAIVLLRKVFGINQEPVVDEEIQRVNEINDNNKDQIEQVLPSNFEVSEGVAVSQSEDKEGLKINVQVKGQKETVFQNEKRFILENEFDDKTLLEIRQKIRLLRNQILSIDSELKRKEDALTHYQQILNDDILWIDVSEKDLYEQIEFLCNPITSPKEFESLEEPKVGFKNFFKK